MLTNTNQFNYQEQMAHQDVSENSQNLNVQLYEDEESWKENTENLKKNASQAARICGTNQFPVMEQAYPYETIELPPQLLEPLVQEQENQPPPLDDLEQYNAENFFNVPQSVIAVQEQQQYLYPDSSAYYNVMHVSSAPSTYPVQYQKQLYPNDHGHYSPPVASTMPIQVQYQHSSRVESSCSDPSNGHNSSAADSGPVIVLPDTLDTAFIVDQLSCTITSLGFKQNDFAKIVLDRSQGTLSSIMKSPKPWNTLTKKGQSVYLNMNAFLLLSDADKRRVMKMTSENAHAFLGFPFQKKKEKKKKKDENPRTKLTVDQKSELNKLFNQTSRPSKEQLQEIAQRIHVEAKAVSNYFQNTRNKRSRRMDDEEPEAKRQRRTF